MFPNRNLEDREVPSPSIIQELFQHVMLGRHAEPCECQTFERDHVFEMVRITVDQGQGFTRLGVEGSLTQSSSEELRKCWKQVSACMPSPERLSVDLTGMMNIDSAGKEILI